MRLNNTFTRRWFIGGMAAGIGTMTGSRLFAAPGAAAKPGARLRIGVLSDVHLRNPGDEATFLKALAYFRDHGADGVLIAGDIADTGRAAELKICADSWFKTFPNGKAPDFHLPETPEGRPGACVFSAADLPLKGRYRFDVRPIECFGHKGRAINAELEV